MKVKNFLSKYIQTLLLLIGLIATTAGVWLIFSYKVGIIMIGIVFVLLAFMINQEKKGG
ncbi:putative membrane protein [Pediococcus claussenii ATCC BAA-344]|uniref:Membrane protein n=1 Tax=Pediococcus claussenii (strain ATCC BAA-344 / DSM 14800 / JCM 18046 / KCTC 3811 / LMG 21948 / P06) TaxID=701521 RepID=G8PCB1_PEDCP|nr:putative membrane protein [Pediococcus claussenii ATCC BAA-344]